MPPPVATLAAQGELVALPNTAISVKSTETLEVVTLPVSTGVPVRQGSLLSELDLRDLQRDLNDAARDLTRVRLNISGPEVQSFRVGDEVTFAAASDDSRRFRGRVESASQREGVVELSIRPLELPFLALGVAEELRLTR